MTAGVFYIFFLFIRFFDDSLQLCIIILVQVFISVTVYSSLNQNIFISDLKKKKHWRTYWRILCNQEFWDDIHRYNLFLYTNFEDILITYQFCGLRIKLQIHVKQRYLSNFNSEIWQNNCSCQHQNLLSFAINWLKWCLKSLSLTRPSWLTKYIDGSTKIAQSTVTLYFFSFDLILHSKWNYELIRVTFILTNEY